MNKRKLQDFASWAKQNLEQQIVLSLKKIGINSAFDIKRAKIQGDITIVEDIETSFKKQFYHQREDIIRCIKEDGYHHTIEQFASTWFNRLIALRFLEVHDYLDHGFKIFPKEANTLPEILSKLSLVKDDLKLDMDYVNELSVSGKNHEELYRYIIFQQCNVLAKPLPMLFSSDISYLEYFIPTPLLFGETIINKLIEIEESDFKEDVEIIGWLYQFYISSKKAEVFASKQTITKDTLPAVTQLFTPDWIVKYMAENSIGRIWLESYPNSSLKQEMNYYVDEAEQELEVIEKLKVIRYKNVDPEEIKIVEPCSGSGHILVYCFDLLLKMYEEKGYNKKDIPSLILKNNLVGFDVDQRATQLASFALVMRARSIDNRFFEEGKYVRPKVYEIIDSKSVLHCDYNGKSHKEILREYNEKQWIGESRLTKDELTSIDYLMSLFSDAKVVGSLLKVNDGKYLLIRNKLIQNVKNNTQADIFTSAFYEREFKDILKILRLAHYLSSKYDVMITNPPYIGVSGLETAPKSYLVKNYPDSKTDMFAMFMETGLIKKNGYLAMINMHSWMFLQSYEKLRQKITRNMYMSGMIHLGAKAFEEIAGEVVQTTSFVIRNTPLKEYNGIYFRLIDSRSKEKDFINKVEKTKFYANGIKFLKIPGYLFAYWISKALSSVFEKSDLLSPLIAKTAKGLSEGDINSFVFFWWEMNRNDEYLLSNSRKESISANKKWVPVNKGGSFRKWYGNNENVIFWENNGKKIKNFDRSVIRNEQYYFEQSITWNQVSTGMISFRYKPYGHVFDAAGPSVFANTDLLYYLIALCNSVVINLVLQTTSPTLNYDVGKVSIIPTIVNPNTEIVEIAKENINLVKIDWDSFENSWEFKQHPLLGTGLLESLNKNYNVNTTSYFNKLKSNEEKLNEYFINLYGLQDELTKDVDDSYVSISIADKTRDIKSLISYLIGVLMGRYSLREEGLIFAGGTFDPSRYGAYDVDKDGIIPIYSDIRIEDGLIHRITALIKQIYGVEYYRDNIDFIADALGKKSNETSEETLNRYLNDGFYQDHLKTYQKRPIYWMFSSGKLSGFKALIYMHRYNEDTLAKMNASYFQPATTILRNQITEIELQIAGTSNDAEKRLLEKKRLSLVEQLTEAREYGQVLDYMANKYLPIDLDDGVKVNYAKFQGVEVTTNSGRVKKDLLIPIK